MSSTHLESRVGEMLSRADVRINGTRPWDVTVHNGDLYARVLRQGSLGVGESYMDGWWDCPQLDLLFFKIFTADIERRLRSWRNAIELLKCMLANPQTRSRSARAVEQHYDLGNELFKNMLDRRMVYTSGRWMHASNLDQAQEAHLDFVCCKVGLEPGMKVLDVGCGWGSFAKFAAEKYGVHVVGITLSEQQLALGKALCAGLPVELRLEDYRSVRGSFDRVVSLGMFEHVGPKNHATFFRMAHEALQGGGKLYLSTIGSGRHSRTADPWFNRYIFPNSKLPSISEIDGAIEGCFVAEEWRDWAVDYDRTLMAWFQNFDANWEQLKGRYNERFYRMWKFYLLLSAGAFRARRLQVWQISLFPIGLSLPVSSKNAGTLRQPRVLSELKQQERGRLDVG